MSDQNIALRLKLLIENLRISNSQFADECNISRPTLSQLLTGRNKKVSDVIIAQIHNTYPNLSILWLMFGEGCMWNSDSSNRNTPNEEDDQNKQIYCQNYTDPINICNNDNIGISDNSEIIENQTIQDISGKCKELSTNTDHAVIQDVVNDDVIAQIKNSVLLSDLAKNTKKTRKVTQITIYYDYSTFETFYPEK